jgi:hypothetical protein
MHSFLATPLLLSLVAAVPAPYPQDIDFDLAYALANPTSTVEVGVTSQIVTYTPAAIFDSAIPQITSSVVVTSNAAAGVHKRSACAPQPAGATGAPAYSPDSASAFTANVGFASAANAAPVPSGYSQTFQNLQGSNK